MLDVGRSPPVDLAPPPAPPARYLALGDSYTIGESVAEDQRWPVLLAEALRRVGDPVEPPQIIARTGWTTADLERAVEEAAPRGPYQLVSLQIGVNNQFRGESIDVYREELAALLARAVELAGGAGGVLVLSIPDWGVTPFAAGRDSLKIAAEIDAFNAVKREEVARVEARFVDITPISREAATDSTLLARDGLHPSGKMYSAWVVEALPDARAALARPSSP